MKPITAVPHSTADDLKRLKETGNDGAAGHSALAWGVKKITAYLME